jgi:hypothetical protein
VETVATGYWTLTVKYVFLRVWCGQCNIYTIFIKRTCKFSFYLAFRDHWHFLYKLPTHWTKSCTFYLCCRSETIYFRSGHGSEISKSSGSDFEKVPDLVTDPSLNLVKVQTKNFTGFFMAFSYLQYISIITYFYSHMLVRLNSVSGSEKSRPGSWYWSDKMFWIEIRIQIYSTTFSIKHWIWVTSTIHILNAQQTQPQRMYKWHSIIKVIHSQWNIKLSVQSMQSF